MKTSFVSFIMVLTFGLYAQDLHIMGGWMFDLEEGRFVANPGIQVKSGKIFSISITLDTGDKIKVALDDSDYILPGLIDLHAHYRVVYRNIAKDDTVAMPKIFLANGVTTTFPAGEVEPYKMKDLRERIDRGEMVGPRILNSGPYFGNAASDWDSNFTIIDVKNRVDSWVNEGAKGFKAKGITPELLKALIDRAHQHGLTVTAHLNSGVSNSVNPKDAIMLGIDRVEHFLGGSLLSDSVHAYVSLAQLDPDDPQLQNIIQLYIKHGVYFDATVATYGAIGLDNGPPFEMWADEKKYLTPLVRKLISGLPQSDFSRLCAKVYQVKKKMIKRFYEAGGLITIGSDRPLLIENYLGGGLGGFFIHREMEVLVEAGIPAMEVLKMATIQNAQAIGLEDHLGSIEVSKWADLAIMKGNPLINIQNTRNIHTVVKSGVVFLTKDLLTQCINKLGPINDDQWME